MRWLFELHQTYPVAQAVGILALVCVAGMSLGSCKVRGIGLGTAGVLFAGIIAGHFGKPVDRVTLEFVKEFGLILFVFTIGLQLGPGFLAALRRQGLKLNALAFAIVALGAVSAPIIGRLAGLDPAAVLGVFSGASVNMPSLGAATQTLGTVPGVEPDRLALPALACAVTFPAAILASIGTILLLERLFRVDPVREATEAAATHRDRAERLARHTIVVTNQALEGVRLDEILGRVAMGVTVSRVRHGNETSAATDATVIHTGDRIAAVGAERDLGRFAHAVGQRSDEDLVLTTSDITFRRVVVTDGRVIGKTVGELNLDDRYGVAVTRITRADIEMSAVPGFSLQFGDTVQIVGRRTDLDRAAATLGNSVKELNETHFIPLFIGIVLGIALGTMPIAFPGLPQPVRLGLAGGPLIVAIVLGRVGHIGRLAVHMPANANLAFREFGISLFFAAVGLEAGGTFFATVFSPVGVEWLLAGVWVTVIPLLLIGTLARLVWKMNFVDLSGLLAGSTTNPPALAFATARAGSDAPTVAYATVYPLTMLLRIVCAQVLALTLIR
jgi:putative transport protein